MPTLARPLHRPGHWRRFAMRGAMTAGAAVFIATCLWLMSRHDFATTLVYSLCISTMCWLFIDLGRDLAAMRAPVGLLGEG
ncbi:MAG: hypothetical protein ACXWJ1_13230, partial [Caldimonas sp.]